MKYIAFLSFIFLTYIMSYSQIQSEPKILTKGMNPSYSHNGKYIACIYSGIWIIDLKTNEKRLVPHSSGACNPRWSPDDKKILFQDYGNSKDILQSFSNLKNKSQKDLEGLVRKLRFAIWIVNIDGTNQHKLIEESIFGDQRPFWSPDNKKIAWTHGKKIWIADYDGKHAKPLTDERANSLQFILDWSKDSKTILYFYDWSVFLVDTNSLNQKRLELWNVRYAKYAQDGISICFITDAYPDAATFINKYYFATHKILKDYIKIKDMYYIFPYFDFAPDFSSIIYNNRGTYKGQGVYLDPESCIMKIK